MTTREEVQALIRFLSQDAKLSLPVAMAKVGALRDAALTSSESIAGASITKLQSIFATGSDDENGIKIAKSVLNAAKRVSKKRKSDHSSLTSPKTKRRVNNASSDPFALKTSSESPSKLEADLALPAIPADDDIDLARVKIFTNRAPLVLAFALTLIKYTMPSQPLSSRLSLAQAVTSANSRTKAVHLGIASHSDQKLEEEKWEAGQPKVRIMGREIPVMKRWGYDWRSTMQEVKDEERPSVDNGVRETNDVEEPALWGLDLAALKSANTPLVTSSEKTSGISLPIYNAQTARSYLLRSFPSPETFSKLPDSNEPSPNTPPKKPPSSAAADRTVKERNLACLLRAIDVLCESWASVLSSDELDRRAWSWYIAVRPEVKHGLDGWGGKGEIKLKDILDMRRIV